jgi:hypothetical protein
MMKAIQSLVVAALAAVALAAGAEVQAAQHGGGGARVNGGAHWGGGGWRGGHYSGRYWYPGVGFYLGAPLLWSAWYWGMPYDYYYPRTIVYDSGIERYPASYPDGVMEPSTEMPRSEGAPSQAPAYMNYCASAKAYYPKVTSCPEGWKFIPSR